jgi:hypothetical protein
MNRDETWAQLTLLGPQPMLGEVTLTVVPSDPERTEGGEGLEEIQWDDQWSNEAPLGAVFAGRPIRFQLRRLTGPVGIMAGCWQQQLAESPERQWAVPLRFITKRRGARSRYRAEP